MLRYVCVFFLALTHSFSAFADVKWQSPDSPFVMSEAYPEVPATCETVGDWIDYAPETDDRVSFAITGAITAIEWDGALAYLVMCEESKIQVMCVTYSKDGRELGEVVTFGGGYSRVGDKQIMLDPCLASKKLNGE
jgi:hypothetical protein